MKWKARAAGRGNSACKGTGTQGVSGKQHFCKDSEGDVARLQLHEKMAIGFKSSLLCRSFLGSQGHELID